MHTGYTTVTELPGNKASKEQLERVCHRYNFAAAFCEDKDVLEVACGAGLGLGCLAKKARMVTGGDIDKNILKCAYETYQDRENIEIKELDAHKLPFEEDAFDVVILFEAIYYLSSPEAFVNEAKRILKPDGIVIIGTVNKDWSDFNPSPYSIKYFSVLELVELLKPQFSNINLYGAFAVSTNTIQAKIVSIIRRTAVVLHLIPKTMKGKEFIKRIFFGKLVSIPTDLATNNANVSAPTTEITKDESDGQHIILYAVASNRNQ